MVAKLLLKVYSPNIYRLYVYCLNVYCVYIYIGADSAGRGPVLPCALPSGAVRVAKPTPRLRKRHREVEDGPHRALGAEFLAISSHAARHYA